MPRRFKRGVGPSKRGRHKKYHSAETVRFNRLRRRTRGKLLPSDGSGGSGG